MTTIDFLIIVVAIGIVALVIFYNVKKIKSGKSGCNCGCDDCSAKSQCKK